jgi:hypothetical protein
VSSGIKTDEWEAALIEALSPTEAPEGWKTATEMARTMKVSLRTMCKKLEEYRAKDRLLVQYVMRPAIDGKLTRRPVYAIKPGENPS